MKIQEYVDSASHPCAILPSLSIVNLELYESFPDNVSVEYETAAFFIARLKNGYPLHTLNLSVKNSEAFNAPPNLDSLHEVKGLKVQYKLKTTGDISEYICGSGDSV